MSSYRDELDAARARIETLEAKLKERDAALEAREAELREVQAEALRRGQATGSFETDPAGRAGVIRAAVIALFVFGFFGVVTVIRTPPCSLIQQPAVPAMPDLPKSRVMVAPQIAVDDVDPAYEPEMERANNFNRTAATKAIKVAARLASNCKRDQGPVGKGRIKLVFDPTGQVTQATLKGPPYADTVVGSCIESIFLTTHVPPFDGAPVTVTSSFTIR